MYAQALEKYVNAVRSIMLKHMVGEDEELTSKSIVDLSRLPPCRDNLVPHIYRVNHRLAHYKNLAWRSYAAPSPTILDKAGRRRTRASWNQCVMWPFLPLPSLTCWRKLLTKWKRKKRMTPKKLIMMRFIMMMNRHTVGQNEKGHRLLIAYLILSHNIRKVKKKFAFLPY